MRVVEFWFPDKCCLEGCWMRVVFTWAEEENNYLWVEVEL